MDKKTPDKDPATEHESFMELLGQLINNSAAVVHDEIELVIQRVREKVRAFRSAVVTVAAGVFICCIAGMSLCAALIIELSSYMAPVSAALVTGTALAVIGAVFFFTGYRKLKKTLFKT